MSYILPLLLSVLALAAAQNCTPYGVRIQYGEVLLDPLHSNKAVISFNTPDSCSSSYLRILSKDGYRDISCY